MKRGRSYANQKVQNTFDWGILQRIPVGMDQNYVRERVRSPAVPKY